jgi:hypothetical protein
LPEALTHLALISTRVQPRPRPVRSRTETRTATESAAKHGRACAGRISCGRCRG